MIYFILVKVELIYLKLLPFRQFRKFAVRVFLIPETNRSNVRLLRKISSSSTPSQILNGNPQILFESNRIHYMPSIQTKSLL